MLSRFWVLSLCGVLSAAAATSAVAATLRLAVPTTTPTFGHPFMRSGPAEIRFAVYDTLTREGSTGHLGPALALSWKLENPTTWVFELRPQVKFQDGAPFTAQTVAATLAILQSKEAKSFDLAVEAAGIAEVVPEGELRVRIRTKTPDPILPRRLALLRMVDAEAWARLGPEGYAQTPIGTGPYHVVDWGTRSGVARLEAVPGSWRKIAQFDTVTVRYAPDATARLQALLSNKVDMAFALNPDDIETLKIANMKPQVFPAPKVMALTLRNQSDANPALKDKRVRQALNFAIDRAAISRTIMAGTMPPARTGFTSGTTGGDVDVTPYAYDPDRARKLLAAAGYGTGLRLVAGVTTGQVPNDTNVYEAVAADLQKVGVTLELRALSFPDFIERLTSGKWQGIDMFSMLWGAATYADAYRFLDRHSCDNAAPYFCEPSVMPQLRAIKAMSDPAAREQALKSMVTVYHDLAPAIWLLDYATILATTPKLHDVELAFEGIYFERMTSSP